ncbi:UNVERIFIED_CONTAM: hypothetical protein PYX00_001264 [Menopon gallinae]|uniref:P-type domain-containing protein n=1 Tax=Menopon gallinae TaxID=328185 RepID=A0AAW2IC44_9NEOP
MVLCRTSRSGYEPLGNDNEEYVVYKFLTKVTLCCLGFALCMIVMLYVSECYRTFDEDDPNAFYTFKLAAPKNKKKPQKMVETVEEQKCTPMEDEEKFDCLPQGQIDEASCRARGCCWQSASPGVPWCFYPKSYGGYKYFNVTQSKNGVRAFMTRTFPSSYPNDVKMLRVDAQYQSSERIHVRISDPVNQRFEPPYPEVPLGPDDPPREPAYRFLIDINRTGFKIIRKNGDLLFDAIDKGGFIFADQFLQISATFNGKVYGIGEHQSNFQLSTNWTTFTLFNHDSIPLDNANLYGSHPFYLVLENTGKCHGVFFLNSNAMDIILQPLPAVTFRSIGGIFDFYFFTGPTPGDVIRQYTELIGRPFLPPYWSLGFHLSRLGYGSTEKIREVWKRMRSAEIPFDTQWNDIDYMANNNDFTIDEKKYSDLSGFVKEVHDAGMHYIPILDPGIGGCEPNGTYPPYDDGIALDIFVKADKDNVFVGKVWNRNCTVFPDFTNPKTSVYWSKHISRFHSKIPFDGLWIDMNEPSNFLDGTLKGCPNNSLENPPYLPRVDGNKLRYKTICMSALHYAGSHYNVHNLYGISEAIVTNRALKEVTGKRPFIISRSTFPGLGRFSGHWSGDVASSWFDMKKTISQMLSFSLYGIPMMGADICGFNGNTTSLLCQRWSQLGAFYPFSRNHNTDDAIDQDPVALGPEVVNSTKNALTVRYTLLPYLYTLFWKANKFGDTVARPLMFEFWDDNNTHSLDESFLWGCCLLIVPVLEEYKTTVKTYLPKSRWYDWYTGLGKDSNGTEVTLSAPTDQIPILIRGGIVLPTQLPNVTTTLR